MYVLRVLTECGSMLFPLEAPGGPVSSHSKQQRLSARLTIAVLSSRGFSTDRIGYHHRPPRAEHSGGRCPRRSWQRFGLRFEGIGKFECFDEFTGGGGAGRREE
eukprot:8601142-Pyramimonas_sp.AAC.1